MLKKYLGDGPFWSSILRIALPIALQNLLASSFSLVDTLMVGQLGDVALSSVGMGSQFGWFMSMILFGLISGMSMFASQYWGVGDKPAIRRVCGMATLSALFVSILFCLAGILFPSTIISMFNRDPGVIASGTSYLRIAALSYPATAVNFVLMGILRSTEHVRLPMFVSFGTTLVNAGLNYVLIFGKLGFPEMGVAGAAIATVISAWISPILIYVISLFTGSVLAAPMRELFAFKLADYREFLRKSFPVIANETLWGAGTLVFNLIFANLGYVYFAAVTILRTFENIAFVFFIGLGNASSVMVGKSVGAGDIEDALRDSRRFTVLVPLSAVFLGAICIIFRYPIVGIFNLGEAISDETLATAVGILTVYALEMPIRNIPYITIVGIFRSGGETRIGMKYDLLFLWFCSLPATLIAAYLLKLPFVAVFAVMYIAEDWLKSVFCVRYYLTGKWIKPVTSVGRAGLERYNAENGITIS